MAILMSEIEILAKKWSADWESCWREITEESKTEYGNNPKALLRDF